MNAKPRAATRHRRGVALVLVCAAIALAAMMGYAMLANSSTQMQISANANGIAQADALAESGVNYAMYNLQYAMPAFTNNTWTASNISLGVATAGTFSIVINSLGGNNYQIVSTGNVTAGDAIAMTKQITVVVQATTFSVPTTPAAFTGNVTLPTNTTVNGNLYVPGALTINSNLNLNGKIYAQSLTNPLGQLLALIGRVLTMPNVASVAPPVPVQPADYTQYTLANGITYQAQSLPTVLPAGTTLGPTANNPAGVYYAQNRTVTLNGITLNGTLIVSAGKLPGNLSITGSQPTTITPMPGFPALVVGNQINMVGTNSNLTANGLTWVGQQITGMGNLLINGALFIPNAYTPISTGYRGSLTLNYNAATANVPTFSGQGQNPMSLKVLTWAE